MHTGVQVKKVSKLTDARRASRWRRIFPLLDCTQAAFLIVQTKDTTYFKYILGNRCIVVTGRVKVFRMKSHIELGSDRQVQQAAST